MINITEKDVGRKVKYAGGWEGIVRGLADWPYGVQVETRYGIYWNHKDGSAQRRNHDGWEIVAWADVEQAIPAGHCPPIHNVAPSISHTCRWTYPGFGREEWCAVEGCRATRKLGQ